MVRSRLATVTMPVMGTYMADHMPSSSIVRVYMLPFSAVTVPPLSMPISPIQYVPSSAFVIVTVPPWSPSITSVPSAIWKTAVHLSSSSDSRYLLPFSASTSPPAKASPSRV